MIAVAVVSHGTRELLRECLASAVAAGAEEIVVVDNASQDGSAELVRERFPGVRLVANERNPGYGAGANQAIAAATAPAVLLLNSDTQIVGDALPALERYLDAHPEAGVVGPRLVNTDGSLQRSTYPFPSAADTFLGESGLHLALRRVPGLRSLSLRTWAHDEARAVPWVLGAALLIRRSAFDAVGGFDDGFFLYGEEVDLCARLRAAGYETHYFPGATVVHHGGASTARYGPAMQRQYLLGRRQYLERHADRGAARRLLLVSRALAATRVARDAVARRDGVGEAISVVRDGSLWRL